MELIFATGNENKLLEVRQLLDSSFAIKGLREVGFTDELEEHHDTLDANASQKAWFIYNKFKLDCFAEDTGLEIDALNGAPGVMSARYAGEGRNSEANIQKVLDELANKKERGAQFRTVISLIINRIEHRFEGVVRGEILEEPRGTGGFGYDPIFQPEGFDQSFAELDPSKKNEISHRGRAFNIMVQFLNEQYAHLAR